MFYLFHGDDAYSQKERLKELLAKQGDPAILDLNTTRFDGVPPFAELQRACDAVPFLAQARVVIVSGALSSKPDKAFVDELIAYLHQLPSSTRLFFLESRKLPANHRLLKLVQNSDTGYAKLFERPNGAQLDRWIRDRVRQKGGVISSRAVHALATNIGSELKLLDNEIEKLVLYKGPGSEIDAPDVILLSPYAAETSIFDLVDALGRRDSKRAAELLHAKLNEGADPYYLFSMFTRQIRLLIQVKELAEAGDGPPAIGRQLNLHSYVAGKLFQQCRGFTMKQLELLHASLLEVDVGVKTGRDEMTTALHVLVAGTAANR
jgi:DNA polymerase-3 subunit delta